MVVAVVTIDAKDVVVVRAERCPLDDEGRIRWAHSVRLETPSKFEPLWIVKELAYWCVASAPTSAYYIVLRMPMQVVDVAASSPAPGSRVVRLLYEWEDVVRQNMHLTPAALSTNVLSRLGEEGERLRAAIRYARSYRNGPGK